MNYPYYSYKNYMLKNYNHALYSIPVDLDLSCPNRDEKGNNGCTFCPQDGARSAQTLDAKNIEDQINKAIIFAKNRYKAEHFMLYIQAYTGTFTSLKNQKDTYSKLLGFSKFDAISIGTRPDCLDKSTLEYLKELNKSIDVHIDLGVQTFNDKSLKRINRGHNSSSSIEAIKKLKEYGIKIFAHIIVGLENETRDDWLNSINTLVKLKVDGIKIHNLHIIKDTQLAKSYNKKKFKTLNEYEYAEELIFLIRNIPRSIPIIRISTDTNANNLIAPLWNMKKGQFSSFVIEQMLYRNVEQGDLINDVKKNIKEEKIIILADGSVSLFDEKYKDYYHSRNGAYKQAEELFINNSKLKEKLSKKDIKLLDIGFGMGYNSLAAILLEKEYNLEITALDNNKNIIYTSYKNIKKDEEKKILKKIYEKEFYANEKNYLKLIIGDIRYTLSLLKESYDVIFLDSFSHCKNPSILSIEVFKILNTLLKDNGVLITSNSSLPVLASLNLSNFKNKNIRINKSDLKGILSIKGFEKNDNIPYRDPNLVYRDKQIITNRENEIKKII